MKKSFPPIKTPIGYLPSCIEIENVRMRICVIEFDNGVTRVGYVREDDSPKAESCKRVSIQHEIVNKLDTRVGVWLDTTVSETRKNYRESEEWKWK